jgi:hypothetical protein
MRERLSGSRVDVHDPPTAPVRRVAVPGEAASNEFAPSVRKVTIWSGIDDLDIDAAQGVFMLQHENTVLSRRMAERSDEKWEGF